MTRLLRLLYVSERDGCPTHGAYAGRRRQVTHLAATWVRPASWWTDMGSADPLLVERTSYRVVTDGMLVLEVFCIDHDGQRTWYLSRVID